MTGGSGVARPRTVAGEGAPRLRAAAAVLAQVGEAPAEREGQVQGTQCSTSSQFCRECRLAGDETLRSLLCLLRHKLNCVFCNQRERLEDS